MKSFRTFLIEAAEKKKKEPEKKPEPKGNPFYALPIHGGHTQPPSKKHINKRKRELKESADQAWLDHDTNNDHLIKKGMKLGEVLHTKYPHNALNDAQLREIDKYSNYSEDLSKHLIAAHRLKSEPKNEVYSDWLTPLGSDDKTHSYHKINHLDSALQVHKLDHGLTVYHGTSKDVAAEAKKHPQKRLFMPTYTSTSTNKKSAAYFAGSKESNIDHVMQIHLRPGQAGHYIGEHSSSEFGDEGEFLLPRGLTLEHKKTEKHGRIHVHHMDVIGNPKAAPK